MHTAQLMPLPLTVSCFSKIQIGFTFLVPAHPGTPGQAGQTCVCVWNSQTWLMLSELRVSLRLIAKRSSLRICRSSLYHAMSARMRSDVLITQPRVTLPPVRVTVAAISSTRPHTGSPNCHRPASPHSRHCHTEVQHSCWKLSNNNNMLLL